MGDSQQPRTPLELAEERRAARKAEVKALHDAQRAVDLDAITDLEIEHGDANVGVIHVGYVEGLPSCVACRTPKPVELKRFRVRVTPKNDKDRPDSATAAEELAAVCRIYPDDATYAKLCEARPGLAIQLGSKAVALATGKEESEGKD